MIWPDRPELPTRIATPARSSAVPPEAAILAAVAALQFALAAPPATLSSVMWVHVCGSARSMPLPLPGRREGGGTAACHAGCALTPDRKKARTRP
jgi:hypothetical protein